VALSSFLCLLTNTVLPARDARLPAFAIGVTGHNDYHQTARCDKLAPVRTLATTLTTGPSNPGMVDVNRIALLSLY